MTKPTAEQVEAAKELMRFGPYLSTECYSALRSYAPEETNATATAYRILLAALEAAEGLAKIGRLAVSHYQNATDQARVVFHDACYDYVNRVPTVADSATDQAEALNGSGLTPVLTGNNRQKDGQS